MERIKVPKVYLQLGDKQGKNYPVYYCETGDNTGAIKVGEVLDEGYEIMCAACEAYNELKNNSNGK